MTKSLGKGLSALISEESITESNALEQNNSPFVPELPINNIKPNPYQPRMEMNPDELLELADSIREHGIMQPLIVTKKSDSEYELIAGERRWRAAQLAGSKTVPVVIKEVTPQQMLELAIVENVQRQDLNPLEEALAFQHLVDNFGLTHGMIAKKVSLSRPAIANKIRLLSLPEEVKKGLMENKISEGHARALLGLTNAETIKAAFIKVVNDHLSVRATEELVRRLNIGQKEPKRSSERIIDETTTKYEAKFSDFFGTKIKLSRSKKGGKIVIPFANDDELESIYTKIGQ